MAAGGGRPHRAAGDRSRVGSAWLTVAVGGGVISRVLIAAVLLIVGVLLVYLARRGRGTAPKVPHRREPADYLRLVQTYEEGGRWMEAMVVAKKGIKEFPPGVGFRLALARVYFATGRQGRAVATLRDLLRVAPDHDEARLMLDRLTVWGSGASRPRGGS